MYLLSSPPLGSIQPIECLEHSLPSPFGLRHAVAIAKSLLLKLTFPDFYFHSRKSWTKIEFKRVCLALMKREKKFDFHTSKKKC